MTNDQNHGHRDPSQPQAPRNPGPVAQGYTVPVARVINYAFSETFGNFAAFARSITPFLILVLLGAFALALLQSTQTYAATMLGFLFLIAACVLGYANFAVNWHRFVLAQHPPAMGLSFSQPHLTFAGMGIAIGVIIVVAAVILTTLMTLLLLGITGVPSQETVENPPVWVNLAYYGLMFAAQYPLARLFLIFPAIAMGHPWSLDAAVKASAGNGWRIVLAVFLPPLVVQEIMLWIAQAVFPANPIGAQLLVMAVVLPVTAVGIAALSICYRGLVMNRQPPASGNDGQDSGPTPD